MRNAVVHVCVSEAPPDYPVAPPVGAKAKYRMRARLKRIERRMEESRGTTMNLNWLGWFGHWCDVEDALAKSMLEGE